MPDIIGFEDCSHSMEEITRRANLTIQPFPREMLESMLWSANLMDEYGYFWHPDGLSFEGFVKQILGRVSTRHKKGSGVYFDRTYNLIRDNEYKDKE